MFLAAAARLRRSRPAACAVIEDSAPGVAAGLAAGMRTVAIAATARTGAAGRRARGAAARSTPAPCSRPEPLSGRRRRRASGPPRGGRRARRRRRACPGASVPSSGRPASAAGTVVAAASASASGAPSAWSRRTAASIVSALPASRPVASRTTPPSARTGRPPRVNAPSPGRGRGDRVGDEREPPARGRPGDRIASAATWWPSAMSCTSTPSRASAASARPGSRAAGGRIALKRWVTVRTPRSNAACACAAVASEWPAATSDPARGQHVDQRAPRRGAPGASVTCATGPAARSRSSSAGSGSRRCSGGCAPSRSGCRNGPSRCAPSNRGPARRRPRRIARQRRAASSSSARRDHRRPVRGDAGGEHRLAGAPPSRPRSRASGRRRAKPLTWRSTNPGAAIPLPRALEPDRGDRAVRDLDVAGNEGAADERGGDAEPHGREATGARERRPGGRAGSTRTSTRRAARGAAAPRRRRRWAGERRAAMPPALSVAAV